MELGNLKNIILEANQYEGIRELDFNNPNLIMDELNSYFKGYESFVKTEKFADQLKKTLSRIKSGEDCSFESKIQSLQTLSKMDKQLLMGFLFDRESGNFQAKIEDYEQTLKTLGTKTAIHTLGMTYPKKILSMVEIFVKIDSLKKSAKIYCEVMSEYRKDTYRYASKLQPYYKKMVEQKPFKIDGKIEAIIKNTLSLPNEADDILRKFIIENNRNYDIVQEEVKRQYDKKVDAIAPKESYCMAPLVEEYSNTIVDSVKEENIDILRYMEILLCCNDIDELKLFMPSQENSQYYVVPVLMKESIGEMIEEMGELFDICTEKEEMEEIKKIIQNYQDKLKLLECYRNQQCERDTEVVDEVNSIPNQLIFSKSDANHIYMLDDVDQLNDSQQANIVKMLEELKHENFATGRNNVKKFKNNNKMNLLEKRRYQTRLIFKPLAENYIFVVLVKVKKDMNDSFGRQMVIDRFKNSEAEYQYLKDIITNKIDDDTYLNERLLESDAVYEEIVGKRFIK